MNPSVLMPKIKLYLENRPAFIEALSYVLENKEVGFIIEGIHLQGTLYRRGERNFVEWRPAQEPDFVFKLTPACLQSLLSQPGHELGDLSRFFMSQILWGGMTLEIHPRVLPLLSSGYLSLILACSQRMTRQTSRAAYKKVCRYFR